jgi:Ca2+-binding RTX toxin-like protein
MATINGTDGSDTLNDTNEDNSLNGLGGNDFIYVRDGIDTVDAGSEDDFVYLRHSNSGSAATVTLGAGRDVLDVTLHRGEVPIVTDFQAGAGGDVLYNLETGFWKAGNQYWFPLAVPGPGGIANPFGAGVLRLLDYAGGTYLQILGTSGQWVTAVNFQGVSASQLHADNFNGWSPDGSAAVGKTVTAPEGLTYFQHIDTYGDDVIIGTGAGGFLHYSHGADVIYGGDGNDLISGSGGITSGFKTIYGEGGDDLIAINGLGFGVGPNGEPAGNLAWGLVYGGEGNDRIGGEANPDELHGDAGNDTIFGGDGNDIVDGGDGDDEIVGGRHADTVTGGAGNDMVYGDQGSDLLSGGSGNDFISGNNISPITRIASDFDTVTYAEATGGVIVNLGDTQHSVGGNAVAAGTALDGMGGLDTLAYLEGVIGSGHDDTIFGGAVANLLDGGAGADVLHGGAGDDRFHVDRQGDLTFENPGEGHDRVFTTTSFYLYDNIEELSLLSQAGDAFGVGNALRNQIYGNEFANLLLGGEGNDELSGGQGDDVLYGENGNDVQVGDSGNDVLIGGAGHDSLHGGEGADALYGEDGVDYLIGGASFDTDILVGGAGDDSLNGVSGQTNPDYDLMDGGSGNDIYLVDTGDDLTFEAFDGGIDTVQANVPVAGAGVYLYANVENLMLQSTTSFGVGNELDNQLTGSASGNWLLGGAGNDTINGEQGNDVLFGEGGADTFLFLAGSGEDVVGDFNLAEDVIEFRAYFTSFAQVQGNFVQNGADGAIDLGGGNLVVLHGVTMANLTAANFVFAPAAEPPAPVKLLAPEPHDAFADHAFERWQHDFSHTAIA